MLQHRSMSDGPTADDIEKLKRNAKEKKIVLHTITVGNFDAYKLDVKGKGVLLHNITSFKCSCALSW